MDLALAAPWPFSAVRAELERSRERTEQRREREANRQDVLETYDAGLSLGLVWSPPHLRQQVYGALGLTARVSPDGSVELEGSFDADVIRLTAEVSECAAALCEAEERL